MSDAGILHGIDSRGSLWHRFGLASAAALSVVLLVPLVCSYSYEGGIGFIWKISASPTNGERVIAIANYDGRIRLVYADSPRQPIATGSGRHGPFFWWTIAGPAQWWNLRKTFWDIGYKRSTSAAIGETDALVYFPAWMLIVLCGIAPSLWLRRHLRRRSERNQRGFAVEPSAGV